MIKKRIIIYLAISFGLVWVMTFLYAGCGGSYEEPAMSAVLVLSMLCPSAAVLFTRMVTKEGFSMKGNDSMMLGISLSDGKWKWSLCGLIFHML